MASFHVDSNGERIKTDILVSGYIKNAMKQHRLEIPDEIIGLCFLFWLIKVCDQWDAASSHDEINIKGQYAEVSTKHNGWRTLFGTHIVKTGIFNIISIIVPLS